MARAWALVLAAWHNIATYLSTAPTTRIIRINTSSRMFMLAAEAHLRRPHVSTRRTWPSMTGKLTRVWALSHSFLSASVSARMRGQSSKRPRLHFFLTPASIRLGQYVLWQVATWTPPLSRRWNITILEVLLLGSGGTLVRRPFLYAAQMENSPASLARPDLGIAHDLIRANGTFIVTIVNIVVGPSGNVGSDGL